MILLVVNPLLDELLRGIVVGEGCCQLAQLLDGSGLVVRLYLLLGVVVERELYGLHGLLQVSGLTAELYKTLQYFLCLVPLFLSLFLPFVGQLVPALQTAVCRECEMLLTIAKPYSA